MQDAPVAEAPCGRFHLVEIKQRSPPGTSAPVLWMEFSRCFENKAANCRPHRLASSTFTAKCVLAVCWRPRCHPSLPSDAPSRSSLTFSSCSQWRPACGCRMDWWHAHGHRHAGKIFSCAFQNTFIVKFSPVKQVLLSITSYKWRKGILYTKW